MSNKKNKAVKKPSSQADSQAAKSAQSTKASSKAAKNTQPTAKVKDGLSEEKAAKIIGAVIAAIMVCLLYTTNPADE